MKHTMRCRTKFGMTMLVIFAVMFISKDLISSVAWWNNSYTYRKIITITATADLAINTSVKMGLDMNGLISSGQMRQDKNDLRIVYWNGSSNVEITNRVIGTQEVVFNIQKAITANGNDANYYLYYGNSNAGSPSTTTPFTTGKFGNAIGLGGNCGLNNPGVVVTVSRGGQVSSNNYEHFNNYQGCISIWIKPNWNGDDGKVHTILENYTDANNYFKIYKGSDNNLYAGFYVGLARYASTSTTSWTSGSWYHIVVRWDADNVVSGSNYIDMWVNGTQYTTGSNITSGWTTYTPGSTINIGSDENNQNTLEGIMDDLCVWDRVLTSTEIAGIYGNGTTTMKLASYYIDANLKMYIPFDDTSVVYGETTGLCGSASKLQRNSSTTHPIQGATVADGLTGGVNKYMSNGNFGLAAAAGSNNVWVIQGATGGTLVSVADAETSNILFDNRSQKITASSDSVPPGTSGYGSMALYANLTAGQDYYIEGWFKNDPSGGTVLYQLLMTVASTYQGLQSILSNYSASSSWTKYAGVYLNPLRGNRPGTSGDFFYITVRQSTASRALYFDNLLIVPNLVRNGGMEDGEIGFDATETGDIYYYGTSTTNHATGNTSPATLKSSFTNADASNLLGYDSTYNAVTTTTNLEYAYVLLEFDASAFTVANLKRIVPTIWGTAGGTSLTSGWAGYMWNGSAWTSIGSSASAYLTYGSVSSGTMADTQVECATFVDGSSKIYVLVKSTGTSDGTNTLNLRVNHARETIGQIVGRYWTKNGSPTIDSVTGSGSVVATRTGDTTLRAQSITASASSSDSVSQNITVTVGKWYRLAGWLYNTAGVGNVTMKLSGAGDATLTNSTTTTWSEVEYTFRALTTTATITLYNDNAGETGVFDDISLIELDSPTTTLLLPGSAATVALSDEPGVEPPAPTGTEDILANKAGEVKAKDNVLTKIVVPKDTIHKDMKFSITKNDVPPTGTKGIKEPAVVYELKANELATNKEVKNFEGYLTINIAVGSNDGRTVGNTGISILDAVNRLAVVYWNGLEWVPIGGRILISGTSVIGEVKTNHFSYYGIGVKVGNIGINVSPNPFTPAASQFNTVTVSLDNQNGEDVELKLWDITGVLVKTIRESGVSTLTWDGRNEYGEIVEAGVYIWQLKVGNARAGKGTIVVAK